MKTQFQKKKTGELENVEMIELSQKINQQTKQKENERKRKQ